jgi:glycosyltransferase involved in cell wall biosynthesis
MEIKGIKYISPTFDNSGYAKASRGNILALHKLGIPLTLSPVSFEQARPNLGDDGVILESLVNKQIDYNIVFIHLTPEFWDKHVEHDKTNVGYTIWETSKLHPDWPGYMNIPGIAKVLVGCHWNKETFKLCGVEKPIGVVPHGINLNDFDGIKPFPIAGVPDDAYVFYSIFQWTERKHPLALIKAYWHEFKEEDNVALVLKTYRSSYVEAEKEAIRTTLKRLKMVTPMDYYPPIFLLPNLLTEAEIHGLHARGDCYVSLDRGEGFGLSPFTAGACGNPIIVTGYGGAREYAKETNSYLVDYVLTPVFGMPWSPWYRGDQLWAEPDVLHGANLMRQAYKTQKESAERGRKLKKYIEENLTWDHVGNRIVKELKKI